MSWWDVVMIGEAIPSGVWVSAWVGVEMSHYTLSCLVGVVVGGVVKCHR